MNKEIKTKCKKCKKEYIVSEINYKMYGPYIETTCPICGCYESIKFLNYVDNRTGEVEGRRIIKAHEMIGMAQRLEKAIGDNPNKPLVPSGKEKVKKRKLKVQVKNG